MNIAEGDMKDRMEAGVEILMNVMKNDYLEWSRRGRDPKGRSHEMYEEFCNKLHYTVGRKYIKVVSDNSVSAFIVNCVDDKKFQFGDVLLPAGWAAPARNHARCSVFDTISMERNMRWTGPCYR